MYFGENVREILSVSCGRDLRAARSRTVLPGIESPEIQRRVATNLEHSFGITLAPEDVQHLTTIRAVLQCVRLRRWERELATLEPGAVEAAAPTEAAAALPAMRDRFVRYTPPMPAMHMPSADPAPSYAPRRST